MARFTDTLAAIAEAGGGYPEDFTQQITAAYDEDMSDVNTQVAERDETINVLNERIAELQGRNATLAASVPADNDPDPAGGGDEDSDDPMDDPDITSDDLFKR